MMVSAVLSPLQAGSWLMSILAGLGAAPSSFTVPLTRATVAGSMGVAAGAAAGGLADSPVSSFLLQAANSRHNDASITSHVLVRFMMSPFRRVECTSKSFSPQRPRSWRKVRKENPKAQYARKGRGDRQENPRPSGQSLHL